MHPETWYKLCEFFANRARDTPLRGVYISHFDQISLIKFQFWGSYTIIVAAMGWNLVWRGTPPPCQISPPSVQHVAPVGRKPQNRPLNNLNNRRFALCAMLPVKNSKKFSYSKQIARHWKATRRDFLYDKWHFKRFATGEIAFEVTQGRRK